jgi:hypothetical protein
MYRFMHAFVPCQVRLGQAIVVPEGRIRIHVVQHALVYFHIGWVLDDVIVYCCTCSVSHAMCGPKLL